MIRAVTIFTTAAGTSNTYGLGVLRPTRYIGAAPTFQHWGLIVQTKDNFKTKQGYCVELDRSGEDIFPKVTKWEDRQREDARPDFEYSTEQTWTAWSDDEITQMAKEICTQILGGKYGLRHKNCQAMVNILNNIIDIWGFAYNQYNTLGTKIKGGKPILDPKEYLLGNLDMKISSSQPEPDWAEAEVLVNGGDGDDGDGDDLLKGLMEVRKTWESLLIIPVDFMERAENKMGNVGIREFIDGVNEGRYSI